MVAPDPGDFLLLMLSLDQLTEDSQSKLADLDLTVEEMRRRINLVGDYCKRAPHEDQERPRVVLAQDILDLLNGDPL